MFKKLLILTISIGTLIGCASNSNARVTEVGSMGDISIVDKSVKSQINVNHLLVAQAVFHNDSSKAITGFYRCKFFDSNKMQVGDEQIWQQITIYPNADQGAKCIATDVEATDFKFEFSADGKNVSALGQ